MRLLNNVTVSTAADRMAIEAENGPLEDMRYGEYMFSNIKTSVAWEAVGASLASAIEAGSSKFSIIINEEKHGDRDVVMNVEVWSDD